MPEKARIFTALHLAVVEAHPLTEGACCWLSCLWVSYANPARIAKAENNSRSPSMKKIGRRARLSKNSLKKVPRITATGNNSTKRIKNKGHSQTVARKGRQS